MNSLSSPLVAVLSLFPASAAFAPSHRPARALFRLNLRPIAQCDDPPISDTRLNYMDDKCLHAEEETAAAAAPVVSGARLEEMLQMDEWDDGPLVVNIFTDWCDPCTHMSDDYDAAARELSGRARLVKLDADRDRAMSTRLGISSVPTLLFLDSYEWDSNKEGKLPKAILKEKIYGSIGKDALKALCEQHFFNGPKLDKW